MGFIDFLEIVRDQCLEYTISPCPSRRNTHLRRLQCDLASLHGQVFSEREVQPGRSQACRARRRVS